MQRDGNKQSNRIDMWLDILASNGFWQAADSIQKLEELDPSYPEACREWQFRIPVLPTRANLFKAHLALAKVMRKPEYADIEFKALSLNQCKMQNEEDDYLAKEWDGTSRKEGDTDRDQRGKEVCVYMTHLKRENRNYFTPDQWKKLMLDIWEAFIAEDVKGIGYASCPFGDKPVACAQGVTTPFTYTSYKPYTQRHGLLNQGDPNPAKHADPLEGVVFTREDLEERNIPVNDAMLVERAQYADKHVTQQLLYALGELSEITHQTKAKTDFATLTKMIDQLLAKSQYDDRDKEILEKICQAMPKHEKSILVDGDIVRALKFYYDGRKYPQFKDQLTQLKVMISEHQTNANNNNRVNVYSIGVHNIVQDYWENPHIADCLRKLNIDRDALQRMSEQHPERMQLLYRNLTHITRELLHNEKLNNIKPADKIEQCVKFVMDRLVSNPNLQNFKLFLDKPPLDPERIQLINQLNAYINRVQSYEKQPDPRTDFRFLFGFKDRQYYNRQANRILAEKLVEQLKDPSLNPADIFSDLVTKRRTYASINVLFSGKNAQNIEHLQSGWFFREGIHSKDLSDIIESGERYANQRRI